MKGRRKAKTRKWFVKFELEISAREQLKNRSDQQGRLLDIAAQSGRKLEIVGRLA